MPELHGPIQHVTIAGTLWLLVAFPLFASLFAARFALVGRVDARAREAIAIVSVGASASSLAIAGYHAWWLWSRPPGERFLLQHCWRLVRLGQLDASLDLALDPLALTVSLVVTGIGLCALVGAASASEADATHARLFAWLNALVAATLLLVLADNFVVLLFGWEGVGLCTWRILGLLCGDAKDGPGRIAVLAGRLGDAAMLLGIALFYWGFGGAWIDGDYAPDLSARFAAVAVHESATRNDEGDGPGPAPADLAPTADDEEDGSAPALPSAAGEGYLTLASYAGAIVFMDDARTPLRSGHGDPLRSPFVGIPIRAGLHSFRVHPGGGLDDFLVTHVPFGSGREIALTPFGPTVSFREARDQLAVRDGSGRAIVRESLTGKRGWGSTRLVTLACLLLFAGVAGKGAQLTALARVPGGTLPAASASAFLQTCAVVTTGAYLVARLGFLFVLSVPACSTLAVIGVLTALLAAIAGLHAFDLRRVLVCNSLCQLGLIVMALGVSGYASAIFHVVTNAVTTALLVLATGVVARGAREAPPDGGAVDLRRTGGLRRAFPRTAWAFAVGCLAVAAAPLPGLAGFWSKDEILVRALITPNLLVPGYALFFAALLVTAMTSFSVWRAYYLVFEGPPKTAGARADERGSIALVLSGLAVVCGLAGVILGVSPRLLGGGGMPPIEAWLGSTLPRAEESLAHRTGLIEWAGLAALFLAAATGWTLARSRYERRAPDWESREATSPLFALSVSALPIDALLQRTVGPLALFARGLAAQLDRRVIDGLVNGFALATRALGWVTARVDDDVIDGAARAVSDGVVRIAAHVQSNRSGRVQTYVYVLVLALLVLALLPYWLR